MNENLWKIPGIAATAAGYIFGFMGKAITSGVRTRKDIARTVVPFACQHQ